jgi:GDP-4-dehydro-6-deoxy-D-mannose reductase
MRRRLVVTGVNGFVGQHLAKQAAGDGWSVHGISTQPAPAPGIAEHLDGYAGVDLRQQWPASAPTDATVVHLAGLAAVGPSFDDPQAYIAGNSAMVTNLGEALLRAGSTGRIIGVSTGAVYASSPEGSVHDETSPVAFNSPYAVSKILVEHQLAYYRGRGLDTVVARPFNHFGPGQGRGFLIPDLIARLRELPDGQPLEVGNLDTRRDYTDVRDIARAYLALAEADTLHHDLYNIATGETRAGMSVVRMVCAAMGRPVPETRIDPSKARPNDPLSITGDPTRIKLELSWAPRRSFTNSVDNLIRDMRS